MLSGVLIGTVSAAMQSAAYIFSRRFMTVFRSPVKLVIYSQLWMGLFGIAAFSASIPFTSIPRSWEFVAVMATFVIAYNAAQYCFFRMLREMEASRASSLLGLKVITLALILVLFGRTHLNLWRIVAILLTAVSGVGMNFAGVRMTRRGALFLGLTLIGFSATDIIGAKLVQLMPGRSVTLEAICVMSLAYILLGAVALTAFTKIRFERGPLKGACPYAALWFSAMLLLFASFGMIGVVFGSIIQAGRGIISVLFGVLLAKCGCIGIEPDVSVRLWVRRAVMAVLMLCAIGLYSVN